MGLFSEIPRHNQMDILKKLDFKDFARFKKCSQETTEITKNFRYLLPLKTQAINFKQDSILVEMNNGTNHHIDFLLDEPIRFEEVYFSVGAEESEGDSLEQFCNYMQPFMKVKAVNFYKDGMDLAIIRNLIQLFKVENLYISYCPSANLPELRKMKELHFYTAEMAESDFLLLETERTDIIRGTLTLSSVNKFLKQWFEGKRRIKVLTVDPLPKDHLEMLNGFEYTVHYAPGMKELVEIDDEYCKILNVYSITREDGKKLFISLDYFEDDALNTGVRILAAEWNDDDAISFMRAFYSTY